MDIEAFRSYCLSKKGSSEDFPFDEVTLCLRVMGKIFAITGLDAEEFKVNLKCDPDYALELREQYESIVPGWHMNKHHWNTVLFEGDDLDDALLRSLIDQSYELVAKSLPKKLRVELEGM
ncbi:MAG: MmcQ/YjbR family DNA-binding protein [Saprospiraceae bacterium]